MFPCQVGLIFEAPSKLWKRNWKTEVSLHENPSSHEIFSVHNTSDVFKNVTITGNYEFVFEQNSEKLHFQNVVPSHESEKPALSNSCGIECFRKGRFSWRISVDGRPNRRNKAALSNSSGIVRTGPYCSFQ